MAKGKEFITTISLKGKVDKSLSTAFSKVQGMAKSISGTALKVAGAGFAAAGAAATAFGAASVKVGMEFDSSMSQVAATMGMTVSDLEKQVGTVETSFGHFEGNLREFAQFMGSNTAFSASQAAESLNYLALAGYDAQQSMSMLPNVLNLAAAGSIELADASDMVTDAQSALGLSLEDTTVMVDQMAQASSKSNTSVAQLGEAFLTIGATARNLAGGTTELSTMLGVLADNGIKGAEGGTHLRNMLLSLQNPTKSSYEAFARLGISMDELYDSSGNMRALPDIFLEIQGKMEGMTQASKDAIISGIFNKTDLASANALLGTSKDRFDELTAAISDSEGAAAKMASTQLDNLQGDITLFKSALEGVQIAVSDALTPAIRGFVQFGSEALSAITDGIKEGGVSSIGSILSRMLMDGINSAVSNIQGALPGLLVKIQGTVSELLTNALSDVFGMTHDEASTLINDAILMVQNYINNIIATFDAMKPVVIGVWETITKTIMPIIKGLIPVIGAVFQAMGTKTKIIFSAIQRLSPVISNMVQSVMPMFITAGEAVGGILETIGGVITNNIIPGIMSFSETLIGIWENILTAASPVIERISQFITSMIPVVAPFIQTVITDAGILFKDVLVPIGEWLIKTLGNAITNTVKVAGTAIDLILSFIEPILPGIIQTFGGVIDFITGVFTGDWKKAWEGVKGIFTGIWNSLTGVVKGVITTIVKGINAVINGVNGFIAKTPAKALEAVGLSVKIPTIPLPQFAEGGTVTSPTMAMIGEGGYAETIIPHKDSLRTRKLIETAIEAVLGTEIAEQVNSIIDGAKGLSADASKMSKIPAFAKGAIVSNPTLAMVGEGGNTETIIPHTNTARSRNLLNAAAVGVYGSGASVSGGNTDSRSYNFTFAPVVQGSGLSDSSYRDQYEQFKRSMNEWIAEHDREVFA